MESSASLEVRPKAPPWMLTPLEAGGGAAAAGGAALGGGAGGGAGGGLRSKLCALIISPKSGLSLIIFIIWFSISRSEITYTLLVLN